MRKRGKRQEMLPRALQLGSDISLSLSPTPLHTKISTNLSLAAGGKTNNIIQGILFIYI